MKADKQRSTKHYTRLSISEDKRKEYNLHKTLTAIYAENIK